MFYVIEAHWLMMAFVAYFASRLLEYYCTNSTPCLFTCNMHNVTCEKHPCQHNTQHWFHQFRVIFCSLHKGVRGVMLHGQFVVALVCTSTLCVKSVTPQTILAEFWSYVLQNGALYVIWRGHPTFDLS